jgi:hypothetical protein
MRIGVKALLVLVCLLGFAPGLAWADPILLPAADYKSGGEGVAYHDTDSSNNGGAYRPTEGVDVENGGEGLDVGWTASGEWFYMSTDTSPGPWVDDPVFQAGRYVVSFRVAAPGTGTSFRVQVGGQTIVGTVGATGGWQNYQTVSVLSAAPFVAGAQAVKFVCTTGGFNLRSVEFTPESEFTGELSPYLGPQVPTSAALSAPPVATRGFKITTMGGLQNGQQVGSFAQMNELLDTGKIGDNVATIVGVRLDNVVNLLDNGASGVFGNDASFPGMTGSGNNDFATEALGYIHLTPGLHTIGLNSDDGGIVSVGGVEVGRSAELKGTSTDDFQFMVSQDGYYELDVRQFQRGGGAAFELHDVDLDGNRVLLNEGSMEVYVPEPCSLAVLAIGGLFVLRRRRAA